jgi:hypothetical protein
LNMFEITSSSFRDEKTANGHEGILPD